MKVTAGQVAQVTVLRQHICTFPSQCFHLWFLHTPFPTQHTHTLEGVREHTHTPSQAFSWDTDQKPSPTLTQECGPVSRRTLPADARRRSALGRRPRTDNSCPAARGCLRGLGAEHAQAQRPRGRQERASPRRRPRAARRRAARPRLTLGSPDASALLRAPPASLERSRRRLLRKPSWGLSSAAVGSLQPEAVASLAPLWPALGTHRPPWRRHGGRRSDAGEAGRWAGRRRRRGLFGGGTVVLQSPVPFTRPLRQRKTCPGRPEQGAVTRSLFLNSLLCFFWDKGGAFLFPVRLGYSIIVII